MTDCIIVGGGLIGMLSARELKKLGMDVLLLDKGELGKESSWAGGGILSPLHPWRYSEFVNELASIGHREYPQLAEELYKESGVDPEYIRSGMLVIDSNEQKAALGWAEKWSMQLSVVSGNAQLHKLVPGLGQQFNEGLYLPEIGQMRNPRLVKSARGSLDFHGVEYKENTPVEKLIVENSVIKGVVANGKKHLADNVLIAGGAWSGEILKSYEHAPEIKPVKGQMILFKGEPGLLKTMILAEKRYLIPRKDGRILCGSTIEDVGFDKSTSESVKEELRQSAMEIFPGIEGLAVEHHWAGLRPGSPEGEPVIGEHEDIKGLYINSGHYRNGVILGIGSSCRLAKEIKEGGSS